MERKEVPAGGLTQMGLYKLKTVEEHYHYSVRNDNLHGSEWKEVGYMEGLD